MKLRIPLVVSVIGILAAIACYRAFWNQSEIASGLSPTAVHQSAAGSPSTTLAASSGSKITLSADQSVQEVKELRKRISEAKEEKAVLEKQLAILTPKPVEKKTEEVKKPTAPTEVVKKSRFDLTKKGPAEREEYLQWSFTREKGISFDLAEVLNITQEDADLLHRANAEHHLLADGMDYDDREAVKKWRDEGKAALVEILGEELYAKYREYKNQYQKRTELLELREMMEEEGVILAYEPARNYLKVVMQEFEAPYNHWKYGKISSDQEFNDAVAKQVAYNNRLISKAPGILNPDQVNALSNALKQRLQDEYVAALEYLRHGASWRPGSGIAPLTQ